MPASFSSRNFTMVAAISFPVILFSLKNSSCTAFLSSTNRMQSTRCFWLWLVISFVKVEGSYLDLIDVFKMMCFRALPLFYSRYVERDTWHFSLLVTPCVLKEVNYYETTAGAMLEDCLGCQDHSAWPHNAMQCLTQNSTARMIDFKMVQLHSKLTASLAWQYGLR